MRVVFDFKKSGFLFGIFTIFMLWSREKCCNAVPQSLLANVEPNTKVASKTCLLKPEAGPCRGRIPMYYFKPKSGTCSKFAWGGCQGNGNRFNTRAECMSQCLKDESQTTRPRWCELNFDYGFCFGDVKRYYYDHLWKVCKETIYSGCGGNKNNFYSLEQCDSICRFGNGKLKAQKKGRHMKKGPGSVHKVIIINPPSATQKRGLIQVPKTVATTAAAAVDKT